MFLLLGSYQSGQMGGTVNPLATPSRVRIPHCPPLYIYFLPRNRLNSISPSGGMVDTLVLETSAVRCGSSSLLLGTKYPNIIYFCTVPGGQVKIKIMKQGIHPTTHVVNVLCSCGNTFNTDSTVKEEEIRVEICSKCHPFYTGEKRILKTGAVDKFYARQKKMEEMAKNKK